MEEVCENPFLRFLISIGERSHISDSARWQLHSQYNRYVETQRISQESWLTSRSLLGELPDRLRTDKL